MSHSAALPSGSRRFRLPDAIHGNWNGQVAASPQNSHQSQNRQPNEKSVGNDEVPVGEKVTGIPLLSSKKRQRLYTHLVCPQLWEAIFHSAALERLRSARESLRTAAGSDVLPPAKRSSVACACSSASDAGFV